MLLGRLGQIERKFVLTRIDWQQRAGTYCQVFCPIPSSACRSLEPSCPQTFLGDSSKFLAILSENPEGRRPDGHNFCPKSYRTVWAFIRGPDATQCHALPTPDHLKIALSPRPRRSVSDHIPFTTIGCILLQMDPVSHLLDVTMYWS